MMLHNLTIRVFPCHAGLFMVNEMEEKAYSKKKIDKPIWDVDETSNAAVPAPAIPDDLKCPVCSDLFKVGRNLEAFSLFNALGLK